MTLKLRKESDRRECAVAECRDYPGIKSHGRIFCEAHSREFYKLTLEHIHEDFLQSLRPCGCEPKLHFYADAGFAWTQLECSVKSCEKLATGGGIGLFQNFQEHAFLYLCQDHNKLMQDSIRKDWGNKLLWEWTQKTKNSKRDEEFDARKKAIHASAEKYQGQTRYIARVCTDLRTKGIKMPSQWLKRWEKKLDLRFEPTEWPRAYQEPRLRSTIERHISRYR